MPYIFPKRELKSGDILDPIDMNEDILPSVELYSGNLNEHNFNAASLETLDDVQIESNAYFTFIDKKLVIDPNFGTGTGPFTTPRLTNIMPADKVTNDAGWSAIPLESDRSVTSVITTDNNASVWVEALIQYAVSPKVYEPATYTGLTAPVVHNGGVYLGFNNTLTPGHEIGARVQFAIRLDGAVLPWTITGHENPNHYATRGEKPSIAYVISNQGRLLANQPGPAIEQDADMGMVGNFCYPVRLGTVIDLTAGRHRLELVARRLPMIDQTNDFKRDDIISIYNRRLVAIQIPQVPRSSTTFDSIEVVPFDSESLVSQTAMVNTIDATRDKYNAVKAGALSRASLRDVHLPAPYLSSASATRDSATAVGITGLFPGWAAVTAVDLASPYTWNTVANLIATLPVTLTAAGRGAHVLVLAEVHVQDLARRPCSGAEEDVLGAVAIALSTDGGVNWEVQQDSIVFFNNTQTDFELKGDVAPLDAMGRVNMNIATMHKFRVPSVTTTTTYKIAVVATKIPTARGTPPLGAAGFSHHLTILRGNISAIALRE